MSFLVIICAGSLLAYLPQYFCGDRSNFRMAMRHGMALGLLFTGVDHFINAHTRYLPMMPDLLMPWGLELVYATGVAELAGAMGMLVPVAVFTELGWPNLQRAAGIALAVMFSLLVIANINVAINGMGVAGLDFGNTYFLIRPLFQPLFIVWALYSVEIDVRGSILGSKLRRSVIKTGR